MLCLFFHPHLRIKSKGSTYMSRHLHIKSKTSAYAIGTCFRFYIQMRIKLYITSTINNLQKKLLSKAIRTVKKRLFSGRYGLYIK